MITFPQTLAAAQGADGRVRAGGTDEQELRHRGIVTGDIVDLRDLPGLQTIATTDDGGLRIGSKVRLSELAAHPDLQRAWPGLAAAAAGGLATPQIRAMATVAGSLLQQVRCWYYRKESFDCLKKGGAVCFARGGDHVFHSAMDTGPCIAPHPSTLACALWAFDATVEIDGDAEALRTIPEVMGDGTDPRRTHAIAPGEIVTAIVLPPATTGDRSAYFRAIHRSRAEWPLVEATVRIRTDDAGAISDLALAAGGIANRPVRFDDAARALIGLATEDPKIDAVLAPLGKPAASLPDTAYKARLIPVVLRETLDRALAATPAEALQAPLAASEPAEGGDP